MWSCISRGKGRGGRRREKGRIRRREGMLVLSPYHRIIDFCSLHHLYVLRCNFARSTHSTSCCRIWIVGVRLGIYNVLYVAKVAGYSPYTYLWQASCLSASRRHTWPRPITLTTGDLHGQKVDCPLDKDFCRTNVRHTD